MYIVSLLRTGASWRLMPPDLPLAKRFTLPCASGASRILGQSSGCVKKDRAQPFSTAHRSRQVRCDGTDAALMVE